MTIRRVDEGQTLIQRAASDKHSNDQYYQLMLSCHILHCSKNPNLIYY